MYKRYYSPFEEQPITKAYEPEIIRPERIAENVHNNDCEKKERSGGFFGDISAEDIILIGILLMLLMEDSEHRDIPLVIGVAFLFLIGFLDK